MRVLNLIITGIPSIRHIFYSCFSFRFSFKPYYNWNTFNTSLSKNKASVLDDVLNLIITGIPSIPASDGTTTTTLLIEF